MDIIEDIRAAFIANIGAVKWMDDETREAARRKVKTSLNTDSKNSDLPSYVFFFLISDGKQNKSFR